MVAAVAERDRFGLGWRPALAAGIFTHLEQIDCLEVIADDLFDAPRRMVDAVRTLARQRPVFVHGVGMGLASSEPVASKRLDAMARVVGAVEPEGWSEHLAFVRAGGVEIGHLAAPPRTSGNIASAVRNLAAARRTIGSIGLVEKIATMVDPPASSMDEASWITNIIATSEYDLLLDLHNLHANAFNFHFDPLDWLAAIPLERVGAVHLAGGRLLPEGRVLDDHLHATPAPVFQLLEELAYRTPQALTVILERDGHFPAFADLLSEIDRARAAVARGRARRLAGTPIEASLRAA